MRLEGLKELEPLSKHVHIRVGGPARFYKEARSSDEIAEAIAAAEAEKLPWVILGGGSNTLPSDEGFPGLVILAANRSFRIEEGHVIAEAGVLSSLLARKTAEAGLSGFEWAASLPGTIGGAVRGNAGCFGGEIKNVIEEVEVLHEGRRLMRPAAECRFGYRDSTFKHTKDVVLAATLRLVPDAKEACLARLDGVLAKRKIEQPSDRPSAGCMFKNYILEDAEVSALRMRLDVPEKFIIARMIPAGWLVERAGLKGERVGDAGVSLQHGNFLTNLGTARAADVLALVALVKKRVQDLSGLELEEEVQLLGF